MFSDDLSRGKAVEREFAAKLMKYSNIKNIEFSDGKFPDWDLKIVFNKNGHETVKYIEIKADFKAETTGNVGIEYMCNGHPSGIYTSKADYIVYKIGDKFYYTDRVRFIIELSKCLKADVCGGDNDNSQMWLVKRDVFNLITTEL